MSTVNKQTNPVASELTVTCQVADYLRYLNVPFFHIPNEAKRSERNGYILKRMGLSAGVPDMFICVPSGCYHGLFIELKREKGGKVSDAQREWLDALGKQGYRAIVCKGFDEAKAEIDRYFTDKKLIEKGR